MNTKATLSLFLVMLSFAVGGCASLTSRQKSADKLVKKVATQKVFYYPYESVWRAAQLALKYPFAVNNMDSGLLETESIRGLDGWLAPEVNRDPSAGLKYKIMLNLVKGNVNSKETVRVTLTKKIEIQRDFFSESSQVPTDGLEESVIFYRIERELIIEEALKKVASQN
jgi:uncharacterized protein YceK